MKCSYMARSLSLTDTGHPPLSVKFVTQSKASKCNVSCCYAITSKCVTSEWPVQFSEKALNSTRTREVLICSFISCFQVCEEKWVPGAVFCSQERAESISAEQEVSKRRFPFGVSKLSSPSSSVSAQNQISLPHLGWLHDVVFLL